MTSRVQGVVEAPPPEEGAARLEARLESYKRLADIYHRMLSEQGLEDLLERMADTLADLIPYDTLTIYRADQVERLLVPVLARDQWAEEILNSVAGFDEGLTGWGVAHRQPILANNAHEDPRTVQIPGTPEEPESLITVPLIARDAVKGALNIYRVGEDAGFSDEDFELARRFADAAALAMDNTESRAALERLALTDSLTGLYNHRHFHERLRAEVTRANRSQDSVALLMVDIDDFKRLNDVWGHGVGDQVLIGLSELLREMVRASDVVCRVGGEEIAVIMPSCDLSDALGLADRVTQRLAETVFEPAGHVTLSVGLAQAPDHAGNPRELVGCAEAAMMTAKARGKNRVVVYNRDALERPNASPSALRDVRSISHLKLLQSLAGKLNRLNDVHQIGMTIANELRTLIDYHGCRVYVVEGESLIPIALRGEHEYEREDREVDLLTCKVGEGITGRAAQLGHSLLISNALTCEYARDIPGTEDIDESMIAVPLTYGTRVIGVVVISKLGVDQFDEDDVRLMEVLGGNASVALENARLYQAQRREAESARALLEYSGAMSKAPSFQDVCDETVRTAARLLGSDQSSLWLKDERAGRFHAVAHTGYAGDPRAESIVRMGIESSEGVLQGDDHPFILTAEEVTRRLEMPEGASAVHVAIAPLHGIEGWIVVRLPQGGGPCLEHESLRLLAGISYQCSLAISKSLAFRGQKENAEIANSLLAFGRELVAADDLAEVLNGIVWLSARILGSPRSSVWLEEIETGDLLAEACWGYELEELQRISQVRLPADLVRRFLEEASEPFVLRPEELDAIKPLMVGTTDSLTTASHAVAPLRLDGGRIGCIVVSAPADDDHFEFSDKKMRLLDGMAHQSKLAIANASNFDNLERTFLSTVEALANALEAKDEYTSSHARDITDMSMDVGMELGLDARTLKRLELGALFHDIGKIGIPSEILLKPGPLTDAEREVMETHPELGERILEPIDRLEGVRPIVRACHERFDGRGYPDGLSGKEIPLESRIIFVCDAFHAMTTNRPYRRALPAAEAARRLRTSAGTQFDPHVVETFLNLLETRPGFADPHG